MAFATIKVTDDNGDKLELSVTAATAEQAVRTASGRAFAVFNIGVDVVDAPKAAHILSVDPPPEPDVTSKYDEAYQRAAEQAPAAAPLTAQENAQPAPWEVEDAPKADKKSGRRTNEELAADAGVSLDDVKAWLGDGQRVTKAKIDEFASLHPSAINNQTLDDAAASHDPAPDAVAEAVAQTPPEDGEAFTTADVQEMPTEAFGGWSPFSGEAPTQAAPADDEPLPF